MQKLKNNFLIIILFSFLFILSGCSNSKENLENYYYVMAIGIDSSQQEKIDFSIQIATSSNQSDSQGTSQSNSSNIYTVPCKSIASGLSILNNYLSKKINLSHCSAIIISEELAKTGIKEYINALGNHPEIRPTCNIIISSSSALHALEQISSSNEQFSSKYYEFIKNSAKYTGYSINPELSEFFYCMNMKSNSAIATYASVSENTIQNTGIALFQEDRFLDHLSVLDAISYSLITNRLESAIISIENPINSNQFIDVAIKPLKKTSFSCDLINHYPFVKVNLFLEYSLLNSSISSENDFLKDTIQQYIQEMVLSFLYKTSHQYHIDLCNFQNEISSHYLTMEEFQKIHWEEIYKDAYFSVNIKGNITNLGLFSKK